VSREGRGEGVRGTVRKSGWAARRDGSGIMRGDQKENNEEGGCEAYRAISSHDTQEACW